MANATTEAESNDSTATNVVPQSPQSQEEELQPVVPVIKIKKERNVDSPAPPLPPPPLLLVPNPAAPTTTVTQDDQLRQLLQQAPAAAAAATSTPTIVTTTTAAPATTSRPSSTLSASSNSRSSSYTLPPSQRTIDSYFTSKNTAAAAVSVTPDTTKQEDERKTPPVDLESVRGIFGWTTLEGVHIPFILRGEDRFTAVRIIEKTLLKKFLQALPPDVYSCTYIKSYFITDNEAKLLNEINIKHCDRQYGNELFSSKDLVVLLNDVEQLYEFLSTCFYKLTRPTANGGHAKNGRCGIVKVEGSPIPYVLRNDVRYVPLSLFDQSSAIKALDLKSEKLESWEMSYVKFCCKVAGISHDFLQQDSCLVVSFDDLQQTLGTRFHFEEWWPSASLVSSLSASSNLTQQQHHHHQQQQQQQKIEKEIKYSGLHQRAVEKMKSDALQNGNGASVGVQRYSRSSHQQQQLQQQQQQQQQQQHPSLPRALPASGWYDPGSGVITDAIRGPISSNSSSRDQQTAAAKAVSSSRTVTNQNGNQNGGGGVLPPSTTSVSPYALPELLPSPSFPLGHSLSMPKPFQSYLYSGQYWGTPSYLQSGHPTQIPMVYPTATLEQQVAEHHRRMEQSLNGRTSSNLIQAHSNSGRMPSKSNYTVPIPNNQVTSALMLPPILQVNSDMLNRDCHKEPKTHEEQRSPFYPDGQYRGLPKVTSSEHTVASSILNGSRDSTMTSNGNRTPTTTTTNRASTSTGVNHVLSESFLAKHLLGMNRASPRLENFVVAPGNVQNVAGKMSSPKPANQVPVHVSNYHNYRIPAQLDTSTKAMTTSHSASSAAAASLAMFVGREVNNSKLHQLLSTTNADHASLEPQDLSVGSRSTTTTQGSSKTRHSAATLSLLDAGGYEVQHFNVSGIKFRAIITVMSHSKGPPMVPLAELERRLSPRIQADYYEQILTQGLGIRLYSCSRGQADILKKYVNCSQDDKSSLLICGDDLKRCLPQLQQICTMTKLRTPHLGDSVQSKRLRVETEAVT